MLTRLLQDALGGGTRAVVIATASAAQDAYDETASTLAFAQRATRVTARLRVDEVIDDSHRLVKAKREIARLRKRLQAAEQRARTPSPSPVRRPGRPTKPDPFKAAAAAAVERAERAEARARTLEGRATAAEERAEMAELAAQRLFHSPPKGKAWLRGRPAPTGPSPPKRPPPAVPPPQRAPKMRRRAPAARPAPELRRVHAGRRRRRQRAAVAEEAQPRRPSHRGPAARLASILLEWEARGTPSGSTSATSATHRSRRRSSGRRSSGQRHAGPHAGRRWRVCETMDGDGDGRVSRRELGGSATATAARRRRGPRGRRRRRRRPGPRRRAAGAPRRLRGRRRAVRARWTRRPAGGP